ncbi:DUF3761 domain-containing protein [Leifsonia sp. 21MFCrub1.1]|uniref:DUF3761 domain-containing protein n=1 Tax=Leifsonia sp. 21MFCrub1.1 TaxID=1798223 RepID=UPI001E6168FE|nr:DUF3761 domain-containing protein [Leifsonia sp. 21MFCrub1.1]
MSKKKSSAGFVAAAFVLLLTVGGISSCVQSVSQAGQQNDSYSASIDDSGDTGYSADDSTETPSTAANPTADSLPPVTQADHVGETSEKASAEVTAQGLLVAFADTAGNILPSEIGWSVVGEEPLVGSTLPAGSTVRLIISPPPPPPAPAPAPAQAPAPAPGGATALCNDGTLSFSAHHQGTCSHHGGVREWYR